jgi:hypothetical protein
MIRLLDPRAALARLAASISPAALWPAGRRGSLAGLQRREFPLEGADARAAAEPLAFG